MTSTPPRGESPLHEGANPLARCAAVWMALQHHRAPSSGHRKLHSRNRRRRIARSIARLLTCLA